MADEQGAIEFSPWSTAIRVVRWVPAPGTGGDSGTLTVVFVSGRSYEHDSIPRHVVEAFREAASAGRFYNDEIKGSY